MQGGVQAGDWELFKKQLFKLYPGSTGEQKYAITDLRALVKKRATIPIETAEEFGTYHRQFLPIATFLYNKSRLSQREISLYFLNGLGQSLKAKVQAQLRIEKPTNLADDPYTLEEISAAVIVVSS